MYEERTYYSKMSSEMILDDFESSHTQNIIKENIIYFFFPNIP